MNGLFSSLSISWDVHSMEKFLPSVIGKKISANKRKKTVSIMMVGLAKLASLTCTKDSSRSNLLRSFLLKSDEIFYHITIDRVSRQQMNYIVQVKSIETVIIGEEGPFFWDFFRLLAIHTL